MVEAGGGGLLCGGGRPGAPGLGLDEAPGVSVGVLVGADGHAVARPGAVHGREPGVRVMRGVVAGVGGLGRLPCCPCGPLQGLDRSVARPLAVREGADGDARGGRHARGAGDAEGGIRCGARGRRRRLGTPTGCGPGHLARGGDHPERYGDQGGRQGYGQSGTSSAGPWRSKGRAHEAIVGGRAPRAMSSAYSICRRTTFGNGRRQRVRVPPLARARWRAATLRRRAPSSASCTMASRLLHVPRTGAGFEVTSNTAGCGAAWLARLTGGQEVPGSNPGSPTRKASSGGCCSGLLLPKRLCENLLRTKGSHGGSQGDAGTT